jgi:putative phosphoribosyl transferase
MDFFKNREEAGRLLAEKLKERNFEGEAVVYALPRGGVVLGFEIAKALHAPLDLIITRKIGHPASPEYAIGVISEEGDFWGNEKEFLAVDQSWLAREKEKEQGEAKRRREKYLQGRSLLSAAGKTAIIVDDGVATGFSILLALRLIRKKKPKRIIIAVPVISSDIARLLQREVDELVALIIDRNYRGAVGAYYEDFPQVEDAEVMKLLLTKTV